MGKKGRAAKAATKSEAKVVAAVVQAVKEKKRRKKNGGNPRKKELAAHGGRVGGYMKGEVPSAQGSVRGIVQGMMNPASSPSMRLATTSDCSPTSVVDLHMYLPVSTVSYVGTYSSVTLGSSNVFFFRDPLRMLVYLSPNVPPYTYTANFYAENAVAQKYPLIGAGQSNFDLNPLYFTPSAMANAPHGAALFCGVGVNGKTGYFWCDPGANLVLTNSVANLTGSQDLISVYMYSGGAGDGEVFLTAGLMPLTGSPPSVTIQIPITILGNADPTKGGYFRIVYEAFQLGGSRTVTLAIQTTVNTDVMAHVAAPNALQHLNQLGSARVNAASLLLSNGAANQYNDGFIEAANVSNATPFNQYIGTKDLSPFAQSVNFYSDVFKKGMYTYLKMADSEDIDFFSYCSYDVVQSCPASCAFPLTRSRFVVVRMQSSLYAGAYPGLEYLLTGTLLVEYQTNDQWFDASVPRVLTRDVEMARDLLRPVPCFFENPTHLQRIAQAARGLGGFLRGHSSKIGSALSALFPQWAPVFGSVSRLLGD
jgi:hypothetical protein